MKDLRPGVSPWRKFTDPSMIYQLGVRLSSPRGPVSSPTFKVVWRGFNQDKDCSIIALYIGQTEVPPTFYFENSGLETQVSSRPEFSKGVNGDVWKYIRGASAGNKIGIEGRFSLAYLKLSNIFASRIDSTSQNAIEALRRFHGVRYGAF